MASSHCGRLSVHTDLLNHKELGDFLRSRREKLRPPVVGLASGRRRRTPGLRREEVAELAGIGIDWYTRLEQGRSVSPSIATIDALAHALRLTTAEHAHVQALVKNKGQPAFCREYVPQEIKRLIESFSQPAYITGLRWDVLAWNTAAMEVFVNWDQRAEDERNVLLYIFTDPYSRLLFGESWADEAKRMVAQFRVTYDLWAGDPAFVSLLKRLQQGSHEFATWWAVHDIRSGGAGQKKLNHPKKGLLHFEYANFQVNDNPALKVAIYTLI